MNDVTIPADMEHLTEFIQSLIDTKGKLTPSEYRARLDEVMRVDRGSTDWHSEQTRSRYFAQIMHGNILIGS